MWKVGQKKISPKKQEESSLENSETSAAHTGDSVDSSSPGRWTGWSAGLHRHFYLCRDVGNYIPWNAFQYGYRLVKIATKRLSQEIRKAERK